MRQDTKEEIDRYVQHGLRPGGFITAILAGDLFDAVARADADGRRDLCEIVQYVESKTPNGCRGSRHAVDHWIGYRAIVDARETLADLCGEYDQFLADHGLELGSADEHTHDEALTDAQRAWLVDFVRRWEEADNRERAAQRALGHGVEGGEVLP